MGGSLGKRLRTTGVHITILQRVRYNYGVRFEKNEQLAGGGDGVRTTDNEKSLFQYREV